MSRRRRPSSEVDFWPGFTDVLSGMLLTMVFVLTLFAVTQAGLVNAVGGKEAALKSLEAQIAELRKLLDAADDRAGSLGAELISAVALIDELGVARAEKDQALAEATDDLASRQLEIAELIRRLRDYAQQIEELNARLSGAEAVGENRLRSLTELQQAMNRLRQQLAQMSTRLTATESEAAKKALRMTELLAELSRKDARIAELEELEKYTSEFLAKMSDVFKDNPNIKVVGDRFLFQSEVLFASGSADLGVAGKAELDKFAVAFRQLEPSIPRDLDVNVQVQGHTDNDKLKASEVYRNNWDLSSARALGVVGYLASQGVRESMMSASGFGEHAPRIRGNSPAAKAQNRRIEIRITRR